MKKTTGYLTDDGRFFDLEEEAEFAEAEQALLKSLPPALKNIDRFVEVILGSMTEIRRYFNAYSAINHGTATRNDPGGDEPDGEWQRDNRVEEVPGDLDQEDDRPTEEDVESILELPPGVREPVPDVGRHIQPTKVRQQRPIHGARGRRGNASGVRDD
jgi:hypothetical protein